MSRIKFVVLIFSVGIGQVAYAANFLLPSPSGPFSVSEGSPVSFDFDTSSVPAGVIIGGGTLSVDWSDGGGFAWSDDARATFLGGVATPATRGALTSGGNTTLEWDFSIPAGTVNSTLSVLIDQSTQRGSTGIFENFNLTLNEFFFPFTLSGSILPGSQTTTVYTGIQWYEFFHDGGVLEFNTNGSSFDTEIGLFDSLGNLIESDDDGGTGLDSSISRLLDSGLYYASFSQFNSNFADDFSVTGSIDNGNGTLVINRIIPEPSSSFLLGLSAGVLLCFRRRSAIPSACC